MIDRPPSHSVLANHGLPQKRTSVLTEADVLITAALADRAARQPDLGAENQAFATLAQQLTGDPQSRLETLVQTIKELCPADTVGVSLQETLPDGSLGFRWVAIAGALGAGAQTAALNDFSPWSMAARCGQPQLYARPERYFADLGQSPLPIVEALLVPICGQNQPLGTLWLLTHTEQRPFDREDLRLSTSLAGFAAAALQSMHLCQEAGLALQSQQALKESEAFNHSIFESSVDCIKILDLDGCLLSMNGPGRCLMEVEDCTPLVGTVWVEFWQVSDRPKAAQAVTTAQAGGTGQFSGYCPTLKGTPKWWEVVVTPILDGSGQPKQLLVVSRDVSDRKQAEQILRQSEEQSRNILASISDAFVALDQNWQFIYVNPTAETLLGYAPGDLTGKDFWEEFPGLAGSQLEEMHRRVMRDRVAESLTAFYPDHDRWYHVRSYPAANGITIYFTNVTEQIQTAAALRQSEERYRTLFESIDEGFCVVEVLLDAHGTPSDYRVLEVNPMFEQQTGLQHAVGKTARQLNLEEHWIELYGRVALTGEATRFENSSKTLGDRWFDVYACRMGEPEARKVAIIFKNISDRKQAEALFQRTAAFDAFRVSLTDALRPLADPVEVQATASYLLGEHLGANRVAYFEVCGTDYVVEQDYVNGVAALAGCYPIDSFGPKLLAAYRAGRTVAVADVQADPHLSATQRSAYAAIQIESYIGIPLIKHGEFVAGLAIHAAEPRVWTPDEIALVEEVAERTWAAVERVRAEVALQQTSAELERQLHRFDAIATSIPDFIYTFDCAGRFTYFNPQLLDLFQKTSTEVLGKTLFEIDDYPADLATKIHAQLQQVVETRQPLKDETAFTNASGSGHYEYVFVPLFDVDGAVEAVAGVSRDITHRKQAEKNLRESEERFRMLADQMSQFAWMADQTGSIFWYNRRWFEYTGTTLESMQGWGWQQVHHPEHVDRVVEHFRHCVEAGKEWEDTFPLRSQDGTYGWFLSRAVPVRDAAGNILRWFGTNTDITERLQVEQEREQLLEQEQAAREAAERTNRLKDEFLAVLSHELRSPLNPILGWARLLRGGKLDPVRTAEALATIERNAKLQCQLIDDLLDISRIMQGKLVLNAAPVSLAFVISSAIETVQLAADARRVAIEVYSEPNVGQVAGDAGRLQQVVWNLLTNAVKFTPAGGRVDVRLTQVNHQAWLQVSDTGKGITPEFLPYVFEHFRQEDGATTRKFGGLGLGLAIAKQIVTLHGGKIWVESPGEDQGATFTVELPCLQTVPVEDVTNPIEVEADHLPLANLRVLIADDDADSREFVMFVVEQAGAEVTAVSSASQALQQLTTASFDLLLSDIGMPEMDGYELMRQVSQLQELGGQTPAAPALLLPKAIALTAYAGELNQQQALAVGFQGHITKPVEPDDLIKTIVAVISSN
ncbi:MULTISPECIES: PAS domain-containing protein [Cyanophyceae]|uniref:histidine kinase n=1 Tax=Leptolyngbya subtilissima DQ-A4 TaxID=2933933 RepID=A0ABV0K1X8_9CYAN|nr:PAS domain-containing protein [Nodosilinea sp. FACHB-141]MBD2112603.1 PAS domain S-box protein [Nodosilinea sp. FACHB-141]